MCNQSCLIVSNENAKKAVASATVFFLPIVIGLKVISKEFTDTLGLGLYPSTTRAD